MDILRIQGGSRLSGTVAVSGSKNAALPIMAASILAQDAVRLRGVPRLTDVDTLCRVLGRLGVRASRGHDDELTLQTVEPTLIRADYRLVRRMRASFCVLGPLVARRGRAVVSLPGGCKIGDRPVDLHLAGLAALGADVRLRHGYVIATAKRLVGATIDMRGARGSTVTGTANVLSAATLARGVTTIVGAAREPEVVDLGNFLTAIGANISGLGTDVIRIAGVDQLAGGDHEIIPDRIEAATLLIAAAITRGFITLTGVIPEHLAAVLDVLSSTGSRIEVGSSSVSIETAQRPKPCRITARPYPGIPTDVQAQLTALLSLAEGRSALCDNVFPERFAHLAELTRLGARSQRHASGVIVEGVAQMSGAHVKATDLRASAALVLAGLAARGETIVHRIGHLDRGYERLEVKLDRLGANIERLADPQAALAVPLPDSNASV